MLEAGLIYGFGALMILNLVATVIYLHGFRQSLETVKAVFRKAR